MLSSVSDKMLSEKFDINNKIKEWWSSNIEYVNNDSKMTSTELWNKFKKDNKEFIGENNITIEMFKDIITSNIVNSSNYVEKSKKSAIEFIGFKWKENEIKQIDNLELDNIVYHIESVSHTISISENGNKTFKSSLSLSMGVDNRSNENIPVYGEMDYPDSYKRRKDDFEKEKLLPGFSDSQDVSGRNNGEKIKESTAPGFTNPGSSIGLKNKGNKK
jgi:hypothetical protein